MKAVLRHSKEKVNKAGYVLAGLSSNKISEDDAIEILENFRSIHAHPLMVFRMSLRRKSKIISSNSLISQRLKRAPSIVNKLKIQKKMSLSRMQDIGGLRVVMSNMEDVYKLKDVIRSSEKQPAFKYTLLRETDYIKFPKESGYRSIHLIYKYEKNVPMNKQCSIEIQLRTKVQHAWATAVEVIGTYLRQPLKQSFGDEDLLDLFKEISKMFVLFENKEEDMSFFENTIKRMDDLRFRDKLRSFSVATYFSTKRGKKEIGKYFLILLNFNDKILSVERFPESKLEEANNKYSELEKEYLNNKNVEVVLVLVDDIKNLKKLYPNYFLDTREFLKIIEKINQKINNYKKLANKEIVE
ncbi:MAG: RelA/SpoT domain-containing protein [Candidatus Omnitrophica bacterium]|nr:RelA/SpoT domain-containing protein [Candidatus Omnitrophota bacterium]